MREETARHVAAVRMRSAAPMAALVVPAMLLVTAAAIASVPCTGEGCHDPALAVAMLAAPTVRLALALGLPDGLSMVLGAATSLPLWGLAGRGVAGFVIARSDGPARWVGWWLVYAAASIAWLIVALLVGSGAGIMDGV